VTVSNRQVHLSQAEFESMNRKIMDLMLAATRKAPGPGRKRRVFTYLFIPLDG